jgi:hypothetical protein
MSIVYNFEGVGVTPTQGMAATAANTGANLTALPSGSSAIFDTAMAAQGTFGLKLTTSTTGASLFRFNAEAKSLTWQRTTEMTLPATLPTGANAPTFWSVRYEAFDNSVAGTFLRLILSSAGALTMTRPSGTAINLGTGYTAGQKIRIASWGQVGTTTTNGVLHVRIYASGTSTVLGSHDSTNSDLGLNPVWGGDLGANAQYAESYVVGFDSDQWGTVNAELPALASNAPPTVNVGADVTLGPSGGTVSLVATASDTDGTIASYAWTFHSILPSSTAPTITNAGNATASVIITNPGRYVLRCTVTDNAGATAFDSKKVFVPAATVRPILDLTNAGAWTLAGGATTAAGALADESDATLTQGPTAPASEATQRILLAPMLTPTSFSLNLKHKLAAAGTVVCKVRLYEANVSSIGAITSSTLRKEWTLSPTTTAATANLTLTTGEIATVTQWNEVFIEGSEL